MTHDLDEVETFLGLVPYEEWVEWGESGEALAEPVQV